MAADEGFQDDDMIVDCFHYADFHILYCIVDERIERNPCVCREACVYVVRVWHL